MELECGNKPVAKKDLLQPPEAIAKSGNCGFLTFAALFHFLHYSMAREKLSWYTSLLANIPIKCSNLTNLSELYEKYVSLINLSIN